MIYFSDSVKLQYLHTKHSINKQNKVKKTIRNITKTNQKCEVLTAAQIIYKLTPRRSHRFRPINPNSQYHFRCAQYKSLLIFIIGS